MDHQNDRVTQAAQKMTKSVTKSVITFIDLPAAIEARTSSMDIDIFKGSNWRHMLNAPADQADLEVRLSTGKTVTLNPKILQFLRALADELAQENTHH